jgi:hypothetical protein
MAGESNVSELAHALLDECERAWWNGGSSLPDLGRTYSPSEQRSHERELARMVDQALAELRTPPATPGEREAIEHRMTLSGRTFARSSLGVGDAHMDLLLQGGFTSCAREFAERARAFDPAMAHEDIAQASRNVWTANGLQTMLGLPLRVTPSVFAYSMLYPYTDNLLDDPNVTEAEKARGNERFGRRIAGENLAPENLHEETLWSLFAEIESEHPRVDAPCLYESLEAIHSAQTRSVLLLRRDEPPYGVDVLGISLEKGGASVLADGYLVAGSLTREQASLFFGLGALLQLADDLQDVDGDARSGTLTIFSQAARRWPLDRLVSRLLHFRAYILAQLRPGEAPGAAELADLLRSATLQLILAAVGGTPKLFTRGYVRDIETFSPFRFRDLLKQKRRLEKQRVSLVRLAASALAEEGPRESRGAAASD